MMRRATTMCLGRVTLAAALFCAAVGATSSVFAQTATFRPRDEKPEEFPAGPGRDEAFYACTPCHNFKLVAAQGMTRVQWEDSLAWMTKRHNMVPLEGPDREAVLKYLETTYPPRAPERAGGWQNPFLNR